MLRVGRRARARASKNYLGFPDGIGGTELAERSLRQARKFGAEIVIGTPLVSASSLTSPFCFELDHGPQVHCRCAVVATGVEYRQLEVEGVSRLADAGVYYGAAPSECHLYRDADVYVVGGGNSAGQTALNLSRFAHSVTMLVRGGSLAKSMSHYLIRRLETNDNITVRLNAELVAVEGKDCLEAIIVRNAAGEKERLRAAALFILIGGVPQTAPVAGILRRDGGGYLLTGRDLLTDGGQEGWPADREPYLLETSVPGIFAAGDVRHGSVERVASAVGDGAIALRLVHAYLSEC